MCLKNCPNLEKPAVLAMRWDLAFPVDTTLALHAEDEPSVLSMVADQSGCVSRKFRRHSGLLLHHEFLRPILVEPTQLVSADPLQVLGVAPS